MKHFARIIFSLMLVACCAMVAHADTASDSSTGLSDFRIILNDPTCSSTTCVQIGYDGTSDLNAVLFLAPSPIQIPAGQTAACASNFDHCLVFFPGDGDGDRDDFFYGVLFFGITPITPGEDLDIGVSGLSDLSLGLPTDFSCEIQSQCANGVINFSATPEPPPVLLLGMGLLLLLGFFRRKGFPAAQRAS